MLIPNGKYKAHATDAKLALSSSDNDMVVIQFEIDEGECEGQRIAWFGYFSEKAIEITHKSLRTCGWKGGQPGVEPDDFSGCIGTPVSLTVEQETYEGKTRSKVKWVNPVDALGFFDEAPPDRRRLFNARMKGTCAALDKKLAAEKGKPKPKRVDGAGAGASSDDDVGF